MKNVKIHLLFIALSIICHILLGMFHNEGAIISIIYGG